MNIVNRRRFLETLAASAVCIGIDKADGVTPTNKRTGTWFIARQKPVSGTDCGVDFWSKPYCGIDYADQLPSEFVRGVLWYDDEPFDPDEPHPSLRHVDLLFTGTQNNWMNDPRLFVAHRGTREDFSNAIINFVGEKVRYRERAAILALDSQSLADADPDWAEMLPAFRRCYNRVIGHFDIGQG
jgi:hypothetical protein